MTHDLKVGSCSCVSPKRRERVATLRKRRPAPRLKTLAACTPRLLVRHAGRSHPFRETGELAIGHLGMRFRLKGYRVFG